MHQIQRQHHSLNSQVPHARDGTGPDFHEPIRPVTSVLNWPVDRQKLQHLDHTLPCQTGIKTVVYTRVTLHYVHKYQLSLHHCISIQSNENIACQFQPVTFVSFCTRKSYFQWRVHWNFVHWSLCRSNILFSVKVHWNCGHWNLFSVNGSLKYRALESIFSE